MSLYSNDQRQLEAFVERAVAMILGQAQSHLTLTSQVLRYCVKEAGLPLEQREFSGLLGCALRSGEADTILCLSSAGNRFRVIVHSANIERLQAYLLFALDQLIERQTVAVANIRNKLYPAKEWGTWYHCSAILCRLAYLGIAVHLDENTFGLNPILRHALRDCSCILATADLPGVECGS